MNLAHAACMRYSSFHGLTMLMAPLLCFNSASMGALLVKARSGVSLKPALLAMCAIVVFAP